MGQLLTAIYITGDRQAEQPAFFADAGTEGSHASSCNVDKNRDETSH
jgi:hypothetical protein